MHNYYCTNNLIECTVCRKLVRSHELMDQHKREECRKYVCRKVHDGVACKRRYSSTQTRNKHELLCGKKKGDYKCDKCGKMMVNKYSLNRHAKSCNDIVTTQKISYDCPVLACNRKFTTINGFKRHLVECIPKRRASIEKLKTSPNSHLPKIRKDGLPYRCTHPLCGRSFDSQLNLERHQAFCSSKTVVYSCTICQQDFRRKYERDEHERTCGRDESEIVKDRCPNEWCLRVIDDSKRANHAKDCIKRSHCVYCNHWFIFKNALTLHECPNKPTDHTNPRAATCYECKDRSMHYTTINYRILCMKCAYKDTIDQLKEMIASEDDQTIYDIIHKTPYLHMWFWCHREEEEKQQK